MRDKYVSFALNELERLIAKTDFASDAALERVQNEWQSVKEMLDLFEKDFILFIGSNGQLWKQAAHDIIKSLPFPLQIYTVGCDGDLIDPDHTWYRDYDVTITGAVLVRPDGHVAWCSKSMLKKPKDILSKVLKTNS